MHMSELAHMDAVVTSAGPAGLAAAFACQDEGLKPIVADTSRTSSAAAAKGESEPALGETGGAATPAVLGARKDDVLYLGSQALKTATKDGKQTQTTVWRKDIPDRWTDLDLTLRSGTSGRSTSAGTRKSARSSTPEAWSTTRRST